MDRTISFFKYATLAMIIMGTMHASRTAFALTASVSLEPAVADLHAMARDILHGSITVKNIDTRRLALYPFVFNIDNQQGRVSFVDPSAADKATSLANWISISRGMFVLDPGEIKKIDYDIDLGPYARPGIYHAAIIFADGNTRDEAAQFLGVMSQSVINIQVMADVHEVLQIQKFTATRSLVVNGLPSFRSEIANIGNHEESPKGEIRILNNRGAEVATLPWNDKDQTIVPSSTVTFMSDLAQKIPPGSYRAVLDVTYGSNEERIQDTVFFWYLPWYILVFLLGMLLIIVGLISWYIHARYMRWHYIRIQHLGRQLGAKQSSGPMVVDLRDPPRTK